MVDPSRQGIQREGDALLVGQQMFHVKHLVSFWLAEGSRIC